MYNTTPPSEHNPIADAEKIETTFIIVFLVLFFFSSLLLCLNLSYNDEIRTMIFGFYFQIIGIFEMYEALILNITKGKLK